MPRKILTLGIADDMIIDQITVANNIKSSIKNTQILFSAANGIELLDKLKYYTPDILVIDLYMPFMSGWEVLIELEKIKYTGKIIAISSSVEKDLQQRLKLLNVTCFAYKNGQSVVKAINEAINGRCFFDVNTNQNYETKTSTEAEIDGREIEILNKLAQGKNSEQIASEIGGLTTKTIETYIQNLIMRFECKNRVQLIALAYYHGLIYTFESLTSLPKPKPKPKPKPMEME